MSNNQPTVEFGSISYTVDENDFSLYRIEVIRNGSLNRQSWVNFNVVGGTATEQDYNLSPSQEVYFDYEQNRQFIEVQVGNDGLIEDIETLELEIIAGDDVTDNYVVGEQNTTTVEIIDGSPTVEFGSVSYTVDENDSSIYRIEVIRNGELNHDSWVNFNVVGGTATGEDYDLYPNQEVHFSYGQNRQFIELNARNDGLIEDLETLELEIIGGDDVTDNYVVG